MTKTKTSYFKVAAFQGHIKQGNAKYNLNTTLQQLEIAESQGIDILCMPESFLHGYFESKQNAINFAHKNNLNTIISHRSGDTEDSFIADLAMGTQSTQLKSGAPARSERTAKYNRISEIIAQNKSINYLGLQAMKI